MSYLSRLYNHRNAQTPELKNHQPFFSKKDNDQGTKGAFFQAKLSVNQPGDSYEREADSVANAVVKSQGTQVVHQNKISSIQRLATAPEEEKVSTNDQRMERDKEKPFQLQKKSSGKDELKEEDKMKKSMPVQMKHEGISSTASQQVSSKIENSAGKGNKLPPKTLHEMNSSFGTNFNNVRIHNDSESAAMNKELQAHAFTHGSDIYFSSGKYNPQNSEGKFLLAHELTHVIQQAGSEQNQISRKTDESNFPFAGRVDEPSPGEFLLWNFSIGGSFLKQEHLRAIPQIAKSLKNLFKENDNAEVDIEGLASSSGAGTVNDELAKRRANTVLNALVTAGVESAKIKTTSTGSAKAFPDVTAENMAKSRGVRIIPVLHSKVSGKSTGLPSVQSSGCSAKMLLDMTLNGGSVLVERTGGFLTLEAGDGRTNPGIEISATANFAPKDCGDIEFVQNVQPFREIVYKDGSRNRFSSGAMLLDGGDPFGSQKTVQNTGDLITKFTADSPAQRIDTLFTEGITSTIEVRDEFKMYLLFKPKTGTRQTMQIGLWTWVGQLRNNDSRLEEGRLDKDAAISRVIPKEGKGITSTEMPVFSPVAQDMKWQTTAGQPGSTFAAIHAKILNKNKQKI
jgi:outer membrane protein OmpA-like peptidoglycan-associated protein